MSISLQPTTIKIRTAEAEASRKSKAAARREKGPKRTAPAKRATEAAATQLLKVTVQTNLETNTVNALITRVNKGKSLAVSNASSRDPDRFPSSRVQRRKRRHRPSAVQRNEAHGKTDRKDVYDTSETTARQESQENELDKHKVFVNEVKEEYVCVNEEMVTRMEHLRVQSEIITAGAVSEPADSPKTTPSEPDQPNDNSKESVRQPANGDLSAVSGSMHVTASNPITQQFSHPTGESRFVENVNVTGQGSSTKHCVSPNRIKGTMETLDEMVIVDLHSFEGAKLAKKDNAELEINTDRKNIGIATKTQTNAALESIPQNHQAVIICRPSISSNKAGVQLRNVVEPIHKSKLPDCLQKVKSVNEFIYKMKQVNEKAEKMRRQKELSRDPTSLAQLFRELKDCRYLRIPLGRGDS